MRYELPLFFLVVKTNVNYTVVGSFVTQNETTASIEEALHVFREWNPQWRPKYFMTDFCQEEINAIESTFEGTWHNVAFTRWQGLEKRDLSLPQTTQLYIDKIIALSPEINIALIPSNNDGTRTVNRWHVHHLRVLIHFYIFLPLLFFDLIGG